MPAPHPTPGLLLSCLLLAVAATASAQNAKETRPPNILFILVDDLGWRDLGYTGSDFYESPHIDRLAAQSYVFDRAYSAHPVCSPTRAAILTGRHPTRIGITDWIPGLNPPDRALENIRDLDSLPLAEITVAEILSQHGYRTFFAGKWHLGGEGYLPTDQGFATNIGGGHYGQPPGGYYSPYQNPKLPDGPPGEYLTDRLTEETLGFIRENHDRPFFAYLSYYTVHTPIQAARRHLVRFEAKRDSLGLQSPELVDEHGARTVTRQYDPAYASMIYALDENVGRLLDALDELGIRDKTLIVFTSDNGGLSTLATQHQWTAPTSVRPLRAGKGWAYEGGIRVPLIIDRPRPAPPATVSVPVVSMDLLPTILEEAGVTYSPPTPLDGRSLIPLMDGTLDTLNRSLFWDYPHYHGSGWTPGQALRMEDFKLVCFYETDTCELYDLSQDAFEQTDIAGREPGILIDLMTELVLWRNRLGTRRPQ